MILPEFHCLDFLLYGRRVKILMEFPNRCPPQISESGLRPQGFYYTVPTRRLGQWAARTFISNHHIQLSTY
jgi:hypothetical protein